MTLKGFLGRFRARMNRIWGWSGMIMGVFNLLTFAFVQKDTLGFPIPLVMAGALGVVVGIPTLLVAIEEKYGIWGDESRHIWTLAGWDPAKVTEDLDAIKRRLEIE